MKSPPPRHALQEIHETLVLTRFMIVADTSVSLGRRRPLKLSRWQQARVVICAEKPSGRWGRPKANAYERALNDGAVFQPWTSAVGMVGDASEPSSRDPIKDHGDPSAGFESRSS